MTAASPRDRRPSEQAAEAGMNALPTSGASCRVNATAWGAASAVLAAVMPDGRTIAAHLDAYADLRAAVAEVPRHTGPRTCGHAWCPTEACTTCGHPWPCPTERLHRLAEGSQP